MGPGPQPHFQIYFLSDSDVGVTAERVTLPDHCLFDFNLHKITWGAGRLKFCRPRVWGLRLCILQQSGPEELPEYQQAATLPPLPLQPYPRLWEGILGGRVYCPQQSCYSSWAAGLNFSEEILLPDVRNSFLTARKVEQTRPTLW